MTPNEFTKANYDTAAEPAVRAYEYAKNDQPLPGPDLPPLYLQKTIVGPLDLHWRHCRWNQDIIKSLSDRLEVEYNLRGLEDLGVPLFNGEVAYTLFWSLIRQAFAAYHGII